MVTFQNAGISSHIFFEIKSGLYVIQLPVHIHIKIKHDSSIYIIDAKHWKTFLFKLFSRLNDTTSAPVTGTITVRSYSEIINPLQFRSFVRLIVPERFSW